MLYCLRTDLAEFCPNLKTIHGALGKRKPLAVHTKSKTCPATITENANYEGMTDDN